MASPTNTVRTIVDSILPVEEEIRRFRARLQDPVPDQFEHAAESREQLLRLQLKLGTGDGEPRVFSDRIIERAGRCKFVSYANDL